ncbi:hypothetical protein BH09PAT4_BH09PAT4_02860 [soil metagenome]
MNRAEQPSHEQLRSFDPLASVDMMRFDLQRFGHVLPETRQRVYDEELSYIAEGIDRASRTEFTLQRDRNGQLVYFDEGAWRPYNGMLLTGLKVAEAEAGVDPRKQFLADWAVRDWQKGMQMGVLKPGETMEWHSSYPHEIEERYGKEFLQSQGLKPHRKMGFLYQASCHEDGAVTLVTQTVDRSDPQAFAAVKEMLQFDAQADVETMVRTYDGTLSKAYGGKFYAGRRQAEINENAWQEIIQHKDLVEYFLNGIESLAAQNMERDLLEQQSKRHTYGVWAALKRRLDAGQMRSEDKLAQLAPLGGQQGAQLLREVSRAYSQAQARQEMLVGCGGAIGPSKENLLDFSGKDAFDSIFGDQLDGASKTESSYKFDKHMYCVVCQAPPSETEKSAGAKKMCGPCGICKGCDTKIKSKNRGSFVLAA